MKSFKALLGTFVALALTFSFTSCSDVDSDSGSSGGVNSSLSYDYVTRNRGFIGGSVIYNPDGTNNQIEVGTKIGLRLGFLKSNFDTVYQLDDPTYEGGSVINVEVSKDDVITGGAFKTVQKKVSEDIPERARYGFLDITTVDAEKISFSVTIFSADGSSRSVSSRTVKLGELCDLNGDDINDIKYDKPPIMRQGYENARWLTFICDEDEGHTTMYYTFTDAEKAAGYRAVADSSEASIPECGFYGVNSDGSYVFLQKDEEDAKDAVFGDFIIDMDETTPGFSDKLEITAEVASEGEAASAPVASTANINANCYTLNSENEFVDSDKFFNQLQTLFKYTYSASQFPHPQKGPSDLLENLVATPTVTIEGVEYSVRAEVEKVNFEVPDSKILPTDSKNVISLLNRVMGTVDAMRAIAYSNGQKEKFDELNAENLDVALKTEVSRRIIDSFYTQSPKADIKSPDISNVYPFMFVNAGSVQKGDQTVSRAAYYDYEGDSRSVCSSYGDFKTKRDAINKKWDEFHSFKITKATFEEQSSKTVIDFEKDLGLTLAGGVKGGASITSSKTQIDIGAAIYVSIDVSSEQIINNFIRCMTAGLKIGIPDTQVYFGPVPVVYGCSVTIGFNLTASFNPHICFVGLYGGEASFGATYGIEWKGWWVFKVPVPYFDTFGSGSKICETECYFGFDETADKDVTWGPWVKVCPSVGLGWSALSVRASVPVKATFSMTNTLPSLEVKAAELGLKVQFVPYFELTVLSIIHIKKDFGTWDIVNGTLQLYPTPVHWK